MDIMWTCAAPGKPCMRYHTATARLLCFLHCHAARSPIAPHGDPTPCAVSPPLSAQPTALSSNPTNPMVRDMPARIAVPRGPSRPQVPHTIPEGGFLLPCFVSPEEEQAIVALCDDPRQAPPWQWVTRGTSTHVRWAAPAAPPGALNNAQGSGGCTAFHAVCIVGGLL